MLHMFASDPAGSFEGPPARPECSSFLQPRLQPFSYGVYETFFDSAYETKAGGFSFGSLSCESRRSPLRVKGSSLLPLRLEA